MNANHFSLTHNRLYSLSSWLRHGHIRKDKSITSMMRLAVTGRTLEEETGETELGAAARKLHGVCILVFASFLCVYVLTMC